MSLPNVATQREFCRRLFRCAAESTAVRHRLLDDLADAALEAQQQGAQVIATSVSGGPSVQFEAFKHWTPDALLSLIDAARTWVEEATIEEALALIGTPVSETHYECGLER